MAVKILLLALMLYAVVSYSAYVIYKLTRRKPRKYRVSSGVIIGMDETGARIILASLEDVTVVLDRVAGERQRSAQARHKGMSPGMAGKPRTVRKGSRLTLVPGAGDDERTH